MTPDRYTLEGLLELPQEVKDARAQLAELEASTVRTEKDDETTGVFRRILPRMEGELARREALE